MHSVRHHNLFSHSHFVLNVRMKILNNKKSALIGICVVVFSSLLVLGSTIFFFVSIAFYSSNRRETHIEVSVNSLQIHLSLVNVCCAHSQAIAWLLAKMSNVREIHKQQQQKNKQNKIKQLSINNIMARIVIYLLILSNNMPAHFSFCPFSLFLNAIWSPTQADLNHFLSLLYRFLS